MPKRAIVTGAYGQDGSLMVEYLLDHTDLEVFAFVTARPASFGVSTNLDPALRRFDPRLSLVPVDVTNKEQMAQLLAYLKPDYYLNFAAQTSVVLSKDKPEETLAANYFAVVFALDILHKIGKPFRFFNAGSSEELSPADYTPQDEDHPRRFNNPYGISKVLAHHAVEDYRELGVFAIQPYLYNHVSTRANESFLPKKIAKEHARLHYAVQYLAKVPIEASFKNIPPLRVGNLAAKRDWTAAAEVIEAIWLSLNAETPKDYVIASGKSTSVKELVGIGLRKAGIAVWQDDKLVIPSVPWVIAESVPEFYRPAEDLDLIGDPSLIYKDLGWKAKKSVQTILDEMIIKEIDALGKKE